MESTFCCFRYLDSVSSFHIWIWFYGLFPHHGIHFLLLQIIGYCFQFSYLDLVLQSISRSWNPLFAAPDIWILFPVSISGSAFTIYFQIMESTFCCSRYLDSVSSFHIWICFYNLFPDHRIHFLLLQIFGFRF
jgi:hypothetical protein